MTTTQMMNASHVELFSLMLALTAQDPADNAVTIDCIQAILADRGINVELTGFAG